MTRTMNVPCRRDPKCCRNDGHDGDHLYPDPIAIEREAATPEPVPTAFVDPQAMAATPQPSDLRARLAVFARLMEAEWYNGNMDKGAYLRLNADLTGQVGAYVDAHHCTVDEAALAEALHDAYTYEDRDNSVPTLPFIDDIGNFWDPFAARVAARLRGEP